MLILEKQKGQPEITAGATDYPPLERSRENFREAQGEEIMHLLPGFRPGQRRNDAGGSGFRPRPRRNDEKGIKNLLV